MHDLNHIHLLVTAFVTSPPITAQQGEDWLKELVEIIDMQILMDAKAIYCEDLGNEGVTGIVGLTTSHASFHSWHDVEVPFISVDVYSCRVFDTDMVMSHIEKSWGMTRCDYMLVNREPNNLHIVEQGSRIV